MLLTDCFCKAYSATSFFFDKCLQRTKVPTAYRMLKAKVMRRKKKKRATTHQMCLAAAGILLSVQKKTTSAALVF